MTGENGETLTANRTRLCTFNVCVGDVRRALWRYHIVLRKGLGDRDARGRVVDERLNNLWRSQKVAHPAARTAEIGRVELVEPKLLWVETRELFNRAFHRLAVHILNREAAIPFVDNRLKDEAERERGGQGR